MRSLDFPYVTEPDGRLNGIWIDPANLKGVEIRIVLCVIATEQDASAIFLIPAPLGDIADEVVHLPTTISVVLGSG